jgi:hypothetical protein
MTPATALRKARSYLVKHGWTQGNYMDAMGACCAAGAIYRVRGGDVAMDAICSLGIPTDACSITFWNDAPGRTKAEVLAAFTAAIEAAESIELSERAGGEL